MASPADTPYRPLLGGATGGHARLSGIFTPAIAARAAELTLADSSICSQPVDIKRLLRLVVPAPRWQRSRGGFGTLSEEFTV
jgi:hypothetical protein